MVIPKNQQLKIDKYYYKLCLLAFLINTNQKINISKFIKIHKLNRNFRPAIFNLKIISKNKNLSYNLLVNNITKQMAEDVLIYASAKSTGLKIKINYKPSFWNRIFKIKEKNTIFMNSYKPQSKL